MRLSYPLNGNMLLSTRYFLKSDEICRAFLASMSLQTGPVKLQGTACRPSGGEWAVKDAKPWKGAA